MVTPSVLVMPRSALALRMSVSVALLLPDVGSVTPAGAVTVAVLERMPVAAARVRGGVAGGHWEVGRGWAVGTNRPLGACLGEQAAERRVKLRMGVR